MALLEIEDLTVEFPTRRQTFVAVNRANLTVEPGQIHGLVGESGAGKSTIRAAMMRFIALAAGLLAATPTGAQGMPFDPYCGLRSVLALEHYDRVCAVPEMHLAEELHAVVDNYVAFFVDVLLHDRSIVEAEVARLRSAPDPVYVDCNSAWRARDHASLVAQPGQLLEVSNRVLVEGYPFSYNQFPCLRFAPG